MWQSERQNGIRASSRNIMFYKRTLAEEKGKRFFFENHSKIKNYTLQFCRGNISKTGWIDPLFKLDKVSMWVGLCQTIQCNQMCILSHSQYEVQVNHHIEWYFQYFIGFKTWFHKQLVSNFLILLGMCHHPCMLSICI